MFLGHNTDELYYILTKYHVFRPFMPNVPKTFSGNFGQLIRFFDIL